MSTDLAISEPRGVIAPPNPAEWASLRDQALTLARSGLVKKALRGKADDILLIVLAGRELGIPPVAALNKIHVVDGSPTLAAEVMIGMVQDRGHDIWVLVDNENDPPQWAECRGIRKGEERERVERFTWAEAEKITFTSWENNRKTKKKLTEKDNWVNYPKAMLKARAITALCRHAFADVLMGYTYSPDEMGAITDEDGNVVSVPEPSDIEWWGPYAHEFSDELFLAAVNEIREGRGAAAVESLAGLDVPPSDVLADILVVARRLKDEADGVEDAEVVEDEVSETEGGKRGKDIGGHRATETGATVGKNDRPSGPSDTPTEEASEQRGPATSDSVGGGDRVAAPPSSAEDSQESGGAPSEETSGEEDAASAASPSSPEDDDPRAPLERMKHKVKGKNGFYSCGEPRLTIDEGQRCPECDFDPERPVEHLKEHPCPVCGSECQPWKPDEPRQPSWLCSNSECDADGEGHRWSSFHNDPWKPGGEIEQMSQQQESHEPAPPSPVAEQPTLGGTEPRPGESPPSRRRQSKKTTNPA